MLRVSVIGIGNAGGQVADLAAENSDIKAVAINASENDLNAIHNIPAILVGDKRGAGKDRKTAKEFIRKAAKIVLEKEELKGILNDADVLFVVSSTGGGTGSGMNPLLSDLLSKVYPGVKVILIGILPKLSDSIASQQNTIEFLQEINGNEGLTYSLYDNETVEGPLNTVLETVNKTIVEDITAVTGVYQTETNLSSIDERDELKILNTTGRLVLANVRNLREKDVDRVSIEEHLVGALKTNTQAELETDRIVKRRGVIARMNSTLFKSFDPNLPKVKSAFGEPLEAFEHTVVDESATSLVYLLMAGLSMPDDRIIKIQQRIEEATAALSKKKESSVLDNMSTTVIQELRQEEVQEDTSSQDATTVDMDDIMSRYFNI